MAYQYPTAVDYRARSGLNKSLVKYLDQARKRKYFFHTDGGHAWVEVSRFDIDLLDLTDKISTYSYESWDGLTVYLEEDCDCSLYFQALGFDPGKGNHPKIGPDKYEDNSFIRSLPSFHGTTPRGL